MEKFGINKTVASTLILILALINMLLPALSAKAADHAESTSVAGDPGADIGDVFAFLNPNDNSKVVLAITVAGFIVPAEQLNLSFFSPDIIYRFEIENTGDSIPDDKIDITFSQQTSRTQPQTATIKLPGFQTPSKKTIFFAPTTVQTLNPAANPFVITTHQSSGVRFYAGLTDDPFYFDIVGFSRFSASVLAGNPDGTRLQRSRDSFAGYNIHTIAIEVPASMLRGSAGSIVGINGVTMRRRSATRQNNGEVVGTGDYVIVDRGATPAVNTALIPFPRKNEFNAATPVDDANGLFAGSIVASLTALGTNQTNIGILANIAVVNGDYLRLDMSTPNRSAGFGERATTPGYTGFPNGRRTGDDTIDVLLFFISNHALTLGDNVNSNEVPLGNAFPFFAPPHQPFESPADDRTRN